MGRCQGGFCTPNVIKIIQQVTGDKYTSITKKGMDSNMLIEEVQKSYMKEGEKYEKQL